VQALGSLPPPPVAHDHPKRKRKYNRAAQAQDAARKRARVDGDVEAPMGSLAPRPAEVQTAPPAVNESVHPPSVVAAA
jgi:hypothetical protein